MNTGGRLTVPSPLHLAWLYVVAGAIGTVAAGTLLVEKVALLEDPSYVPSCSINPVLSCGSVMSTSQAALLGFPNPMLGIVGFTIVATTGAASLAAPVAFRRWYRVAMQVGVVVATGLVHWLIFQSLYRIGALCPYCMVVWVVTIPIAWYTTLANAQQWSAPDTRIGRLSTWLASYHSAILAGWYIVVSALIAVRFWDYWSTLIG